MAGGVPVIASRLGGLPELIGDERCVPRADPHALAARMRRLWTDPDARTRDGETLLDRARAHHSEETYTQRLLGLYERLRSARY